MSTMLRLLTLTLLASSTLTVLALPTPDFPKSGNTPLNQCFEGAIAKPSETCQQFVDAHSLNMAKFIQANPKVGPYCTNWALSEYYCTASQGAPFPIVPRSEVASSVVDDSVSAEEEIPTLNLVDKAVSVGLAQCVAGAMAKPKETCQDFIGRQGMTMDQFTKLNVQVGDDCTSWVPGAVYCTGSNGRPW